MPHPPRRPTRQSRRSAALTINRAPLGTPLPSSGVTPQPKIRVVGRPNRDPGPQISAQPLSRFLDPNVKLRSRSRSTTRDRDDSTERMMKSERTTVDGVRGGERESRAGRRMQEHLASSAPMSLEDFIKVKPARGERSRSKTITTVGSGVPGSEEEKGSVVPALAELQDTSGDPSQGEPALISEFPDDFVLGDVSQLEAVGGVLYRWKYRPTYNGMEPTLQQWSEEQSQWLHLNSDTPYTEPIAEYHEEDAEEVEAPATHASEEPINPFLPTFTQPAPAPSRQEIRTFPASHVQLQPPIDLKDAAVRRTVLHDPFNSVETSSNIAHPAVVQPTMDRGETLRGIMAKNDYDLFNDLDYGRSPPLPAIGSGRPRPPVTRLPSANPRLPAHSEKTWDQVRAETPLFPQNCDDPREYFKELEDEKINTSKIQEASPDEFWSSGLFAQARQKEFVKRHLATSNKSDDPAALTATSLLVPMFENLSWHQTQSRLNSRSAQGQVGRGASWKAPVTPGALAVGGKDYFAPWTSAPEWCIDRSMTLGPVSGGGTIGGKGTLGDKINKVQTFFGEMEWVKAPERVGRDPRYRPLLQTRGSSDGGRKTGGIRERKDSAIGLHLGRFG